MKLGFYYGLVKDKAAEKYTLLKTQRISNVESSVAAYTRWIKELEQTHNGRYATMGVTFGSLVIDHDVKNKMGVVKVGFSKVAIVTTYPTILATAFPGVAGQTFYLSPAPSPLQENSELIQIRDEVLKYINDAIWSLK